MKARVVTPEVEIPSDVPKNPLQAYFRGINDIRLKLKYNEQEEKIHGFYAVNRTTMLAYYNTIDDSIKTKKTQDNLISLLEKEMVLLFVDKYDEDVDKLYSEGNSKKRNIYVPKNLPRDYRKAYRLGVSLGPEEVKQDQYLATLKGFHAGYNLLKEAYYNVVGKCVKTKKTQEKIFLNLENELIRLHRDEYSKDHDRIDVGLTFFDNIRDYFKLGGVDEEIVSCENPQEGAING